jgi:flagellar assembly protein FliH
LSNKVIKAINVQLVAPAAPDLSRSRQRAAGRKDYVIAGAAAALPANSGGDNGGADQSRKHAYDQGLAAGVALQKEQSSSALKALSQIVCEVSALKQKLLADAEGEMVSLVVAIAEKVIYDEVSTNDQIIVNVLREAFKGVVDREGMKIHLNPQDLLVLKELKPDFLKEFSGLKNVAFEEDREIQRGGALLETLAGEVDARLEQRVKEVKGALRIR